VASEAPSPLPLGTNVTERKSARQHRNKLKNLSVLLYIVSRNNKCVWCYPIFC